MAGDSSRRNAGEEEEGEGARDDGVVDAAIGGGGGQLVEERRLSADAAAGVPRAAPMLPRAGSCLRLRSVATGRLQIRSRLRARSIKKVFAFSLKLAREEANGFCFFCLCRRRPLAASAAMLSHFFFFFFFVRQPRASFFNSAPIHSILFRTGRSSLVSPLASTLCLEPEISAGSKANAAARKKNKSARNLDDGDERSSAKLKKKTASFSRAPHAPLPLPFRRFRSG